jgi:putative peptide zinc metalloprotease protein
MFLISFGFLSSLYKGVVVLGIALAIALKIPTVGLLIATLYCGNLLRGTISTLRLQLRKIETRSMRVRATLIASLASCGIIGFLFAIPVPHSARLLGVVGNKQEQVVHAGSSGFLVAAHARDGDKVQAGDVLCQLDNQGLTTTLTVQQQKIREIQVQQNDAIQTSPVEATMLGGQLKQAMQEYGDLQSSVDRMSVTATISGSLVNAEPLSVLGQFVQQGQPLGTICQGNWVVRTVASSADFSVARPQVDDLVRIRFLADSSQIVEGTIVQVAGAGQSKIEQLSLTHLGGGNIAVADDTLEAAQPYFQILIELSPSPEVDASLRHGMTGWIQFSKTRECFGPMMYRRALTLLNQLRLSR